MLVRDDDGDLMPDQMVSIQIIGADRLEKAFNRFPKEAWRHWKAAAKESGSLIIRQRGLKAYPPSGPGNKPPTPYYVRGIGTQYASFNAGNSERYGSRFEVKPEPYGAKIANDASYAQYLGGEKQAYRMKDIGWRKLIDVAHELRGNIYVIYQMWTDKLLKSVGL
jgi:hypothetical protein